MDNSIQAHQKELCNKLWAMANALRGNMEAYEFKNYILGMIFYYYLSDRTEKYMANLLKDDGISYEDAWIDEEYKEAVVEEALRDLSFCKKQSTPLWSLLLATILKRTSTGCSLICSSTLLNWGIPSKTEVLSWQKSLLLWTKSTSE